MLGCNAEPNSSAASATPSSDGYSYTLGPWTGDSFMAMHRIRDGFKADLPKPEKRVELLIVGAGLSGLGLAHMCQDMDLMLLERETRAGGNAKSDNYKGIEYALGSAYLVDIGEPFGDFYRELGIDLKPLPQPGESIWTPTGFVPLDEGPLGKTIERIKKEMRELMKGPDYPSIPIQKASATALKLDDISYYDWLQKDYPDYVPQADEYCWTALGGDAKNTTAFIGVNGLSELAEEIYAFPGGNAAVAKKLEASVGAERILTGQSVFRVEPSGSGVRVGFFDTHDEKGKVRCIEADQVVLACPYFFAARLIPWADPKALKSMMGCKYGAYLVVNLCFDRQVFHQGYDHWSPNNGAWADFVDADFPAGNPVKDAGVITVYAPFHNAPEGRGLLFKGDGAPMARKVVDDIQMRTKFPKESLKEVRITRYGHQIFCSRKGIIREMLALPRHYGKVHLCHSDGQGCASIESALAEAFALAPRLKSKSKGA